MSRFYNICLVFVVMAIVAQCQVEAFRLSRLTKPPKPTTARPTTTTTPTTTARPPVDVIQTEGCGGVLDGNSGRIAYKYEEQLTQNEVCVWTIRSPDKGQIEIQLENDGWGSQEYVSILSVGQDAELQKSHKIFAGDRDSYVINGQVGYIVFRSFSGGQGFQLYFRGIADTPDESQWTGWMKTHEHFHLNRSQGQMEELAYPNPRALYKPNVFASWVVNPEAPKMLNTLYLYYIDFEDFNCRDFINIHQIDGDSPKFLEKKCNTNTYFSTSFNYKTYKEPFIITLSTNEQNQRSGIILYYDNDRYGR